MVVCIGIARKDTPIVKSSLGSGSTRAGGDMMCATYFRRRGSFPLADPTDGQVFLATKFGVMMKPDGTREVRNDPDYIRMAIDRSLKRLQTDHIDLWYWSVPHLLYMAN